MGTWSERVGDSLRRAQLGVRQAGGARPGQPATRSVSWVTMSGRRRWAVDPFSALEVQMALGRVESEIAAILRDNRSFARGHHLIAARLAFDQLLDEACRLAGVGDLPEPPALRRIFAEAELRTRGWTW